MRSRMRGARWVDAGGRTVPKPMLVALARRRVAPSAAQRAPRAARSCDHPSLRRKEPMKRLLPIAAALAALLLALAGCGEKQDTITAGGGTTRSLTLMLDYLPNPDHVGLYMALADGAFARAGLDVKVQTPSDPAAPLKLVEAGKADLAISYEPELLIARDKGAQLVSVGAIAQVPLTTLMSLKKGVQGPRDLRGGRVGTAGIPYQSAYLQTILQRAGVPVDSVKETNVGFNLVPAMLSKRVDATLGAYWNVEGVQLQRAGKRPHI